MKCKKTSTIRKPVPFLPEAIFFDLDGTLVDSVSDIRACLLTILDEHALHADGMADKFRVGHPLECMIRVMIPTITEDQLASVIVSFRSHYDQSEYLCTHSYPGIDALLKELTSIELPLFVATNKPFLPSSRIIDKMGWSRVFKSLLSPDIVDGKRYSKTQLLQMTSHAHGYHPERCLMVGDLPEDTEAARNAGFRSVAVSWGYGDAASLGASGADWIVAEPWEILEVGKVPTHV